MAEMYSITKIMLQGVGGWLPMTILCNCLANGYPICSPTLESCAPSPPDPLSQNPLRGGEGELLERERPREHSPPLPLASRREVLGKRSFPGGAEGVGG